MDAIINLADQGRESKYNPPSIAQLEAKYPIDPKPSPQLTPTNTVIPNDQPENKKPSDPVIVDEPKRYCKYILTKGDNPGTQCKVSARVDSDYCTKHKNQLEKKAAKQAKNKPKDKVQGAPPPSVPTSPSSPQSSPKLTPVQSDDENEDDLPPNVNAVPLRSEDELGPKPGASNPDDTPPPDPAEEQAAKNIEQIYVTMSWIKKHVPPESRTEFESNQEFEKYLRAKIAAVGTKSLGRTGLSIGCALIENVGCNKGFKLEGFTEEVLESSDVDQALDMLMLKHSETINSVASPEAMLGLALFKIAKNRHDHQTKYGVHIKPKKHPVDNE